MLALQACCSVRTVQQSGLVAFPEPIPPPSSHGAGDVYVGGSALTQVEGSDTTPGFGHYVPRGQLNLAASLRPIAGLTIRPLGLVALPSGAVPLESVSLDQPDAPSFMLGVDVGYTIGDEDEPLMLRVHGGTGAMGIAMRVEDPIGAPESSTLGWMAVLIGGVDVGMWVTPWMLVAASVDARNTPSVPNAVTACTNVDPPFTEFGMFTLNARASVEFEVTSGIGVVAGVGFPLFGSPYASYPIVSLGLRGSFGDARRGLRPRREEPASEKRPPTFGPPSSPGVSPARLLDAPT